MGQVDVKIAFAWRFLCTGTNHITYLSGACRPRSASSSSGNRMDSDPLILSSEFTFDTYKSDSVSGSERVEASLKATAI